MPIADANGCRTAFTGRLHSQTSNLHVPGTNNYQSRVLDGRLFFEDLTKTPLHGSKSVYMRYGSNRLVTDTNGRQVHSPS